MAVIIPLDPIPNQRLSITLDNLRYDLVVNTVDNATVMTITKSGVKLLDNVLALNGEFVIPYDYLAVDGNFAFDTANDSLPIYTEFGNTQRLFYFTAREIAYGFST